MLTNSLQHLHGWLAPVLLAQADGAGSFNVLDTFMRAELFGKMIVILLIIFSLLAWTVMIGKYLDLSRWKQHNLAFYERLGDTEKLMGQNVSAKLRQSTPYARMFHSAVEAGRQHAADREPSVRMKLIENALQRGLAEECVHYEAKMVLLGSLVSGAPFMGLLGTVVGVMVAFNGMANGGNASLSNLAPGVASALLATVCGLLVAIPSVFGYNFLLSQSKLMITELENYASWLADRIELEMEKDKVEACPTAVVPQPAYAPPSPTLGAGAATARPAPAARPTPAKPISTAPEAPASPTERYLRLDVSEDD
jgi:biopolymer transport protein TolQ